MFAKIQCLITGMHANKDGLEKGSIGEHALIVPAKLCDEGFGIGTTV